ncbi:MAG: MFS transporter [bacterium]|nr:MFS transporter [bacterium]
MTQKFSFTPGQIGGHIAAFMLTMGLLCPFVIKLSKRYSQPQLLLWGSLIYGLFFATVGWVSPPWLIVWMFALGASSAVMFIPTLQLSASGAPQGHLATSMGGFTSAGALGFLLGPIVSGGLLSLFMLWYSNLHAYSIVLFLGGMLEFSLAGFLLARGILATRSASV